MVLSGPEQIPTLLGEYELRGWVGPPHGEQQQGVVCVLGAPGWEVL